MAACDVPAVLAGCPVQVGGTGRSRDVDVSLGETVVSLSETICLPQKEQNGALRVWLPQKGQLIEPAPIRVSTSSMVNSASASVGLTVTFGSNLSLDI